METLFFTVLRMDISASVLIAAAVLLRWLLGRAPKWTRCILWALVAVRLACPVLPQSSLSLRPETRAVEEAQERYTLAEVPVALPEAVSAAARAAGDAANGGLGVQTVRTSETGAGGDPVYASAQWWEVWALLARYVWPLGAAAMLLYALVSWLLLRKRVAASVPLEGRLMLCDDVDSPFILGLLRPRVYVPSGLSDGQTAHVVAHENAHLRRRDHWWKPLGYLLLSVHWFDPLVWLSYVLFCRDIELACDERAIRGMSAQERADYSQALLDCAARRPAVCPVAFGEVGVKARVKAVLDARKPALWLVIAAVTACAVLAVCFLTEPRTDREIWLEGHEAVLQYVMDNYEVDGKKLAGGQFTEGASGPEVETYEKYSVRTEDGETYLLFVHGDRIFPNRVFPQGMFHITGVNWLSAEYGAWAGTYRYGEEPDPLLDLRITVHEGGFRYDYEEPSAGGIGGGTSALAGDTLTLKDEGGEGRVNRFRVGDGTLTFLADISDNFRYVKLPDGAVFRRMEGGTPTPWEWTSGVTAEQIDGAVKTEVWTEQMERIEYPLTRGQIAELASRLNAVRPEEVYPGRGFPEMQWLTLQSGEETYHLSWADRTVVLRFDAASAARWPIPPEDPSPSWEIHSGALYSFLAGLVNEAEA